MYHIPPQLKPPSVVRRSVGKQTRLEAWIIHKSTIRKASTVCAPDRYQVTANRYGMAITPYGQRLQTAVTHRNTRRGAITTFSPRSRRRLIRRLSYLYSRVIVFFTATYPDYPEPRKVKRDIEVFTKRLLRLHRQALIVWRVELQKRGSWHVHMLIYGMPFTPWRVLATMWVESAGLPESCIRTSTDVSAITGGSKRYMYYVSKYMSKVQEMPDTTEDQAAFIDAVTAFPGRFWGVVGRENEARYWQSYTLLVSAKDFMAFRRVIRRLRRYTLPVSRSCFFWGVSHVLLRFFGIPPGAYYHERLPVHLP